jgi:phage tail sheath protein FI
VKSVDPGTKQVTLDGTPSPITLPADPAARKAALRVLEIDALIYESGTLVETFAGLSWNFDPTTDAFRRNIVQRLNDPDTGSQLVSINWTTALFDPGTQPTTIDGFPTALDGGDNGSPLDVTALIGHDHGPGQRTGIEALKEKSDIALVAVPGVTDEEVQQALLNHCENLKYRFAILDGRQGVSDISAIEAHRGNYDSLYGGYYTPWLKTVDLNTGNTMLAPPSGYVLGICARVDNTRGVFKAPANEVVQNILDVELPFTDGEQDVLNPLGINLIRAFETRGIRVWGARTTSSDPEWKYVNVRRLFIFLEHTIDNGTQWVVFEPNNEALWARVKEAIESFLFGVWKSGALMGTKPEEAYFVRCDRTTMTQDDIDNGRLVCLIGVAPAYPAEFVIFRIGQFTASTNQA